MSPVKTASSSSLTAVRREHLGVQSTAESAAVSTYGSAGHPVLDPLSAQVGPQEGRLSLDGLRVGLDAVRVMAECPRRAQGRPASRERIEDRGRSGPTASLRRQGHVDQQPGELLVGLAGVLGNGHQVVVEVVRPRHQERPEQIADPFVRGQHGRRTAQLPRRHVVRLDVEPQVAHAGQVHPLDRARVASGGGQEHRQLGCDQLGRLARVDPIARGGQQDRVHLPESKRGTRGSARAPCQSRASTTTRARPRRMAAGSRYCR